MVTAWNRILERVGLMFLRAALALLPGDSSPRTGATRGLAEQRQFDRYEGYTLIQGSRPLPFDRWREIWGTMQLKARGRDEHFA